MNKGDYIKITKNGKVNVGQIKSIESRQVYVWSGTTGQNDAFYFVDGIEPATKAEYDEQVELRLNPPAKAPAPVPAAQKQPAKPARTFRWLCFECGNKYNGRQCPSCGGTDRIENADSDLDKRYLLGGGRGGRSERSEPPEG